MENANNLKRLINKRKNQPNNVLEYVNYLSDFARDYSIKTASNGYVLGISGGIDSALALAILANTPGVRVIGVFVDIESNPLDRQDAESLRNIYQFEYKYINLTDEYHSLVKKLGLENSPNAQANLKVRLRVNALYALANSQGLLTCGTTNAAERLVGYYTKFGDNACDIALLYWLTKAQIVFLAHELKVPDVIIEKKPSAGLSPDQTDEGDLGITYQEIDHYLSFSFIDPVQESKITTKFVANKHKLHAPVKPKKFMNLRNLK